jgi:hypothetical protein
VAWDAQRQKRRPFQVLSTRRKKNVEAGMGNSFCSRSCSSHVLFLFSGFLLVLFLLFTVPSLTTQHPLLYNLTTPQHTGEVEVAVIVYAFDLLFLNGKSLLKLPLEERRQLLRSTFHEVSCSSRCLHQTSNQHASHKVQHQEVVSVQKNHRSSNSSSMHIVSRKL